MTSSARVRIDCGIVRLRALAVFRFMTNSNLQRARRRASVSSAVGAVAAETFEVLNFPGSTSSTANVDRKQY